jgi:hypothetical protein
MNKKSFLFLLAVTGVILVSVITLTYSPLFNKYKNQVSLPTPTQAPTSYQAKVVINAPDENFFIEYETNNKKMYQPFSILEEALKENSVFFEVENYDFGVFVKSINGLESTNEKAWIYFVNGESGQVAADKMNLKSGDLVEWKYVTPSE